jgi:hypothetical protein
MRDFWRWFTDIGWLIAVAGAIIFIFFFFLVMLAVAEEGKTEYARACAEAGGTAIHNTQLWGSVCVDPGDFIEVVVDE